MRRKVLLSWSSGKDSAWALRELRLRDDLELVGLLTVINETHDRVAMHAVRRELLEAQARAVGLPLHVVLLPWPSSNEIYETRMRAAVDAARGRGVTAVAFGDLFLADVRAYREAQLAGTGLEPLFPLWGKDTHALARAMIAGGLRATITCVDPKQIPRDLAGHAFDEALLARLPPTCDPCGERGEFHTFATDGPMFEAPVVAHPGVVVERDGFVFADLTP